MNEQHTKACLERYVQRLQRLCGERYHARPRFHIYFFPRYNDWIITYDDTFEGLNFSVQDSSHIYNWQKRYLTKRGVHGEGWLMHERRLVGHLLTKENEIRTTKEIKF